MGIKNFKSFKNYQKKAPRPTTIEVLGKESPKLQFDKSKLKPFLIKALPAIVGMIIGYIFLSLPGIIIGGIFGHQAARLFTRFCTKKPSSSR